MLRPDSTPLVRAAAKRSRQRREGAYFFLLPALSTNAVITAMQRRFVLSALPRHSCPVWGDEWRQLR